MERVNIMIGALSFENADYDAENDVLYLHVSDPQVGEGEQTPEGHVVRFAPGTSRVVGLTVLGARALLDGHRLGQVTWLVHVVSARLRHRGGEDLERDSRQQRLQKR